MMGLTEGHDSARKAVDHSNTGARPMKARGDLAAQSAPAEIWALDSHAIEATIEDGNDQNLHGSRRRIEQASSATKGPPVPTTALSLLSLIGPARHE